MMFHSSHIHMPNRYRQRSALRTFFPSSSFSPPDAKEPFRRGILFSSVATVLLLVGAILTWLGFNDVFGGKISMTGPLLIALALLMLLLSLRQFMLARKRNRTANGPLQMETIGNSGVTAVVVDHDDGNGAATIVVETWDGDEHNDETRSSCNNYYCRTNYELAPPSYTDIAHSCSSNCPSFISHEDHNEAPPTYEETCGGELYHYNSESSLAMPGSRRCSAHMDGSPCPHRAGPHSQRASQSDQGSVGDSQSRRSSHTLSPRVNFSIGQALLGRNSVSEGATGDGGSSTHQTAGDETISVNLTHRASSPEAGLGNKMHSISPGQSGFAGPGSATQPHNGAGRPPEWSRRSFSSIPSYTCLLSESGEVSAEVFDTSSYIEEMMPTLLSQGKERNPSSQDLLTGTSSIPTRSHSMSSVNVIRQGVPYNFGPPLSPNSANPASSELPNQPLYDQQPLSAALSPQSTGGASQSSQTSPSPSFTCQGSGLIHGSESPLVNLLTTEPSDRRRQVSTQPSEVPKSADISGHSGATSPSTGQVSVKQGGEAFGGSRHMSHDNTPSQGKLLNTQDIQETI